MHGPGQTKVHFAAAILIAAVLLAACTPNTGNSSAEKIASTEMGTADSRITIHWAVSGQGFTRLMERECTAEERAALQFLASKPHLRQFDRSRLLTYSSNNWLEVDGVRWNFFFNSIYSSRGTQWERFVPDESIEFGMDQDDLKQLVEWHKHKIRK